MRGKGPSERTMGQAKLAILVDYYLADMQRRGCTQDSVTWNRKLLRRFGRDTDPDPTQIAMTEICEEICEEICGAYVTRPQVRRQARNGTNQHSNHRIGFDRRRGFPYSAQQDSLAGSLK